MFKLNLIDKIQSRLTSEDLKDLYKELKLYAVQWRDIGTALGFKMREMDIIEACPLLLQQAPVTWLRELMKQWLEWAPGDDRGSDTFATRESLHLALQEANLGQLAVKFQ